MIRQPLEEDAEQVAAPDHIHVTVWRDAQPEIHAPGLAPWLIAAALYEAADALLAETEDDEDD